MAWLALAHASGIALAGIGVVSSWTPGLIASIPALILLFRCPWPSGALLIAVISGVFSGVSVERAERRDCRLHLPGRWESEVLGRFVTRPVPGSVVPFEVLAGAPRACGGTVRSIVPAGTSPPRAGQRVRVRAQWEGRSFPRPGWAERAGILRFRGSFRVAEGVGPRDRLLELRGRIQHRMVDLWGDDLAPTAEALVLARREHLDPDLRDAFALSGTAHLLAISGFHVGVVWGLCVGFLGLLGLGGARARLGALLGCWIYVLGIGAPHAAVRAGTLLSVLLGAQLRGRPVMGTGALGAALLGLLVVQPAWLWSVGFQLSFAATAGLVVFHEPVAAVVGSIARWLLGRELPRRRARVLGDRMIRGGADGMVAGIAATLTTVPLLTWHFDRFSLIGIPLTVIVAPVVALLIPGIGGTLLLSLLPGGIGEFLSGGTGLLMQGLAGFVRRASLLPGASIWIARETLVVAALTAVLVWLTIRVSRFPRVRASVRALVAFGAAVTAATVMPVLPARGALELHLIDVGQGDAIALRSPSGRWLLVDTGPRTDTYDAGARRVVPYLRRHGASRIAGLVLTHPHLDHIGGTAAVLGSLDVRGILDPARPSASAEYLRILETAGSNGVWWWSAASGDSFRFDEAFVTVLHPRFGASSSMGQDPNDWSVVLFVQWRDATILLTGDAPATVERALLGEVPRLTVLKVGHHGSRTSTSVDLVERARPKIALIPVGDGNRFGHPDEAVTSRLEASGAEVYRTDRDGDVRLIIRSHEEVEVRAGR